MTFEDTIKKWWFLLTGVALAILYMLYDRRGRALSTLHMEAQKQLLGQQLQAIKTQAQGSDEDAKKAMDDYSSLKRRHADLLAKLGISPDAPTSPK